MAITHVLKQSTVRIKDHEKQLRVFSEVCRASVWKWVPWVLLCRQQCDTGHHPSLISRHSGRHPCAGSELGVADVAINEKRACPSSPLLLSGREDVLLLNYK